MGRGGPFSSCQASPHSARQGCSHPEGGDGEDMEPRNTSVRFNEEVEVKRTSDGERPELKFLQSVVNLDMSLFLSDCVTDEKLELKKEEVNRHQKEKGHRWEVKGRKT